MHADYLNITLSTDHREAVHASLLPILSDLSFFPDSAGVYRSPTISGTFDCRDKYSVSRFSASGGFLDHARATGALSDLLWCFADTPHRVTRLDIAHDLPVDSPRILANYYSRAKRGRLSLTNRVIRPDQVSRIVRPSLYGGADTGTVYLGCEHIQVAGLKIYDKRNERLDRGFPDPGPMTRFELKLGRKAGVSLRDVHDPAPAFWHHMADIFPTPPKTITPWVRAGEGYCLPPRVVSLPAEALKRSVQASGVLADWLTLADQIGPSGPDYLLSLLARAISDHKIRANAETGLPPPLAQRAIGGGPV